MSGPDCPGHDDVRRRCLGSQVRCPLEAEAARERWASQHLAAVGGSLPTQAGAQIGMETQENTTPSLV